MWLKYDEEPIAVMDVPCMANILLLHWVIFGIDKWAAMDFKKITEISSIGLNADDNNDDNSM